MVVGFGVSIVFGRLRVLFTAAWKIVATHRSKRGEGGGNILYKCVNPPDRWSPTNTRTTRTDILVYTRGSVLCGEMLVTPPPLLAGQAI